MIGPFSGRRAAIGLPSSRQGTFIDTLAVRRIALPPVSRIIQMGILRNIYDGALAFDSSISAVTLPTSPIRSLNEKSIGWNFYGNAILFDGTIPAIAFPTLLGGVCQISIPGHLDFAAR